MIKTLFIINEMGNVVMEKHWRGATPRTAVEVFWTEVSKYAVKVSGGATYSSRILPTRTPAPAAAATAVDPPQLASHTPPPLSHYLTTPPPIPCPRNDEQKDVPPVITTPKFYYVSIQRNGLFFLAIVVEEVPPLLVIELLDRMCRVFKIYFGQLSEATLISNFTTVFMLLEEMLDDGALIVLFFRSII